MISCLLRPAFGRAFCVQRLRWPGLRQLRLRWQRRQRPAEAALAEAAPAEAALAGAALAGAALAGASAAGHVAVDDIRDPAAAFAVAGGHVSLRELLIPVPEPA